MASIGMVAQATKYLGGDGHCGISKTLDKNPKVLDYDDAGTDEGYRIITLVRGWAFRDAAKTLEDDPEGRMAQHCISAKGIKDALEQIRMADPCKCGRCAGKF